MRYGIPLDVFWKLNPKYMYMYQDEYIREKEEHVKMLDISAYFNGLYVRQAISSCISKRAKYPEKPFSIVKKEKPLSEEEKFKLWVAEFNKRFEEKDMP